MRSPGGVLSLGAGPPVQVEIVELRCRLAGPSGINAVPGGQIGMNERDQQPVGAPRTARRGRLGVVTGEQVAGRSGLCNPLDGLGRCDLVHAFTLIEYLA
ncbi:hypothetical protein SDC9_148189 [bioreactor metagenome]|uniref:Uncharacterized protein n=1 Tax=bioreactor metagenome TaxID=1076179 RepID=A0A645EGE4_9ZZZZ